MDEKGFMMGVAASAKVVISKHEKQAFSVKSVNREWVSLIEAICTTGRSLPLFVIFKGVNKQKTWYDVLEDVHSEIATSENGWTDNELGVDWLKRCFEPATARYLQGNYRLLVIDGHAFHISTEFIKFCNEKKIVPLCLPPHTTHLLQPLDVNVFGPLSREYKKQLEIVTRFNVCSVDKVDFLKIIQKARKEAISKKKVLTAWRATGLVPYNPSLVLQKLTNKQSVLRKTDSITTTTTTTTTTITTVTRTSSVGIDPKIMSASDPGTPTVLQNSQQAVVEIEKTPANIDQVNQLIRRIRNDENSDSTPARALNKLIKGAKYAFDDSTLLRITNNELLQANVRRHHKANRSGAHFGGKARVLSLEDVQQRQQWAKDQQKIKDDKKKAAQLKRAEQDLNKAFREMCRFGPDLLGQSSPASQSKSSQKEFCSPQRRPNSPSKRRLLPPLMLYPTTEAKETVEGAKEVKKVKEVEEVKAVEEVQTTRRGRIVRPPRKM